MIPCMNTAKHRALIYQREGIKSIGIWPTYRPFECRRGISMLNKAVPFLRLILQNNHPSFLSIQSAVCLWFFEPVPTMRYHPSCRKYLPQIWADLNKAWIRRFVHSRCFGILSISSYTFSLSGQWLYACTTTSSLAASFLVANGRHAATTGGRWLFISFRLWVQGEG